MAASSGSFGLLKLHYAITDQGVTIARNAWVPFVLLPLIAPGVWCLVQAFSHRHFDDTMFWIGFPCVMLGLFALFMTPWLTPSRVTVTREGVTWGAAKHPVAAIKSVTALATQARSSQYGRYQSWSIVIATGAGKPLLLPLGNHNRFKSTDQLMTLERGIKAALGGAPSAR